MTATIIAIIILTAVLWHHDVGAVWRRCISVINVDNTTVWNTHFTTHVATKSDVSLTNVDKNTLWNTNVTTAAVTPKSDDLLLLISITSGPNHASLRHASRESWLLPCVRSPLCDYAYFIDRHESNITEALIVENKTYGDLVFRGRWCPFMLERHHHTTNYGNYMETTEQSHNKSERDLKLPQYQLRGMYKVDWKVCFTKWALQNHKMAAYHAYVEDDSFTCVDNLLRQLTILTDLQNNGTKVPSIRAGTPMWDGFDDSSTLMSRDIAMVFATLYPSPGFNCSAMVDAVDPKAHAWLSWGNSWMSNRCGWRDKLKSMGLQMVVPRLHKTELYCEGAVAPSVAPTKTGSADSAHGRRLMDEGQWGRQELGQQQGQEQEQGQEQRQGHRQEQGQSRANSHYSVHDEGEAEANTRSDVPDMALPSRRLYTALPCPRFGGVIIHHALAGEKLLEDKLVTHLCEYTLFVDKVKHEGRMKDLWSSVSRLTHPVYHDFSPVLMSDADKGWPVVVKNIENRQQACRLNGTGTGVDGREGGSGGGSGSGSGSGSGGGSGSGSGVGADDASCQAWRRRHLRSADALGSSEASSHGAVQEDGLRAVGVRDYFGGWVAADAL